MKWLSNTYAFAVFALRMLLELIFGPPRVVRHTGLRYGTKNDAVSTQGFLLEVSENGTSWLEVSQNTDIPDVSQEASDLDATNLQSTAKEYIAGLQDSQSVTLTGQRVVLSAGQNFLRDNAGATSTFQFRNTYSDGSILSYAATIKKLGVTGGVDAVMMFTATIRPSGAQTWTGTGAPTGS
jgi:hypothetical protein